MGGPVYRIGVGGGSASSVEVHQLKPIFKLQSLVFIFFNYLINRTHYPFLGSGRQHRRS